MPSLFTAEFTSLSLVAFLVDTCFCSSGLQDVRTDHSTAALWPDGFLQGFHLSAKGAAQGLSLRASTMHYHP